MPDTKFEEARRCTTCTQPARETGVTDDGDGKLHHFMCDNERCRHYQLGHVVRVNSDGSIPERKAGPKQFPTQAFMGGRNYIANLEEELQRGEIRR